MARLTNCWRRRKHNCRARRPGCAKGGGVIENGRSLPSLGRTWQTLNERQKAGACLEAALTIRQQALGTHHPLTAKSHNSPGLVYQVLGDFPVVRQQFETAVALHPRNLA